MQRSLSTKTTPSVVENVAPTGQTWTHGGLMHWLHSLGTKKVRMTSRPSCGVPLAALPLTSMLSTITSPSRVITYRSTQVLQKNGSAGPPVSAPPAQTDRAPAAAP